MFNSNHKLLIFDFDGTLADTRELYKSHTMLDFKKYGYKISQKQFDKNFGLRLDRMLYVLGVRKNRQQIKNDVNKYVLQHVPQIKPTPGISIIKKLKKRYILALVSNSRKKFVARSLRHLKIYNDFEYVLGGDNFISKVQAFKHIFKIVGVKPKEAIYIADRAGDVVVAKQAQCDMISISNKYSWSPLKEIKKATPDKIIKNLKELEKILL